MSILTAYEVIGMITTAVVAIVTFLRSKSSRKQNTVLVSVLGGIFSILFGLRYGLVPEVQEHIAFTAKIRKNPEMLRLVDRLAEASETIRSSDASLMGYVLRMRFESFERQLEKVSSGGFTVEEHEMPEFVMKLIDGARQSFDATSYVQFKEWWDTPWGREYEERNYAAVRRGVTVQRTFIFSSKDEMDAAKAHLEEQAKAGIKVRTAIADRLGIQVTSDMVTCDGKLAGELRLTPGKGMKEAEFVTRASDVSAIQRQIDALRLQATLMPVPTK